MRLSVFYRTHAGTGAKPRPEWFDRSVAWTSLRRSLAAAEAELGIETTFTVVVDGALPVELESAITPTDRVRHISGGSASTSFRACLAIAVEQARADGPGASDTVYWFAEDDYLYRPEAITRLCTAAAQVTADYLTLYLPDDTDWHAVHPSQPFEGVDPHPASVPGLARIGWRSARQTTSTFGVRRSALLHDAWLLRLGSMVGAPFDAATWVALQRRTPFAWRHLLADLDGYVSLRGLAKLVAKPAMRLVLNLVTVLVPRPTRVLVGPERDLAMHVEEGRIPLDQGWAELAELLGS